jgi:hypothetical protein
VAIELGAGDAHDQAQVRDEPIIGAENGGSERVAAEAAVTALEAGQRAAGDRRRPIASQRLDDAGMRALRGRQSAGHRFRLLVVLAAVDLLQGVDRGQHEFGAEAAGKPGERAGTESRLQPRLLSTDRGQALAPELRVRILDLGEAAIDLCQLGILLGLGERAVECRAVDLALKIGAVARSCGVVAHGWLAEVTSPAGRRRRAGTQGRSPRLSLALSIFNPASLIQIATEPSR